MEIFYIFWSQILYYVCLTTIFRSPAYKHIHAYIKTYTHTQSYIYTQRDTDVTANWSTKDWFWTWFVCRSVSESCLKVFFSYLFCFYKYISRNSFKKVLLKYQKVKWLSWQYCLPEQHDLLLHFTISLVGNKITVSPPFRNMFHVN